MLQFDEEKHQYSDGGIIIPSVTYLLEKYNMTDYGDVLPHILEHGRQLGSVVHRVTELHDKRTLDYSTIDPEALVYLPAWVNFLKVSALEITHIEPRLYSKAYGFAGTPDRIGVLKGKTCVIDIKTPKAFHRATGPQTAGYKILAREVLGIRIQKRYGVLLSNNGIFRIFPCDSNLDESAFLACLTLERWINNGKVKNV